MKTDVKSDKDQSRHAVHLVFLLVVCGSLSRVSGYSTCSWGTVSVKIENIIFYSFMTLNGSLNVM